MTVDEKKEFKEKIRMLTTIIITKKVSIARRNRKKKEKNRKDS